MKRKWNPVPLLMVFVLAFLVATGGCAVTPADDRLDTISPETFEPRSDGTLVLSAGGYGYEPGDIVRITEHGAPVAGDIVQYDDDLNGTGEFAFGSGRYLARIIAVPRDEVAFRDCRVVAHGFVANFDCRDLKAVAWGEEWYETVEGHSLAVPDGEFLADRWVGPSQEGNRLTVKQDAIVGIIVEKVGHDKEIAAQLNDIVY